MIEKRILGGYPFRTNRPGTAAPDDAAHTEWLIDQSIQESFPASDPPSPARPGSLVNKRYAAIRAANARSRSAVCWIVGTTLLGAAIAIALRNRRSG